MEVYTDIDSYRDIENDIDMGIKTNSLFKQTRREVVLSVARERLHRAVREGDVENVRKMLTNYKDWFNEASDDPLLRLEDDEPQSKPRRISPTSSVSDEADINICDQLIHDDMLPEFLCEEGATNTIRDSYENALSDKYAVKKLI